MARFHYARVGSGSSLLLLAGSGGWKLTFEALISALAQHHTVYALDPPGQGRTAVLDPTFGYDADAIAHSIAGFLDAVGVNSVAILGHSWGGGFALRFAELHPDRVTRLALIAPAGVDVTDVWEFRLARLPVLGELAVHLMTTATVRHMLDKSFAHRDRVPDERIREYVRMIRSPLGRAARLRDMLAVERSVRWTDTERDLHLVQAPTQVLWGDQDRYFPPSLLERFTSRIPNVQAHIVTGGGHSLHDDCPEQAYAMLRPFLAADHE
ncbi:alpha/beta fold hydrolase [Nocardia asiatica]